MLPQGNRAKNPAIEPTHSLARVNVMIFVAAARVLSVMPS